MFLALLEELCKAQSDSEKKCEEAQGILNDFDVDTLIKTPSAKPPADCESPDNKRSNLWNRLYEFAYTKDGHPPTSQRKVAQQIDFCLGKVKSANGKYQVDPDQKCTRSFPEAIAIHVTGTEIPKVMWLLRNPAYGKDFVEDLAMDEDNAPTRDKDEKEASKRTDRLLLQVALLIDAFRALKQDQVQDQPSAEPAGRLLPWMHHETEISAGKGQTDYTKKAQGNWYLARTRTLFTGKSRNFPNNALLLREEKLDGSFGKPLPEQLARLELYPYRTSNGDSIPKLLGKLEKEGCLLPSRLHTLDVLSSLLQGDNFEIPVIAARAWGEWRTSLAKFLELYPPCGTDQSDKRNRSDDILGNFDKHALHFSSSQNATLSSKNLRRHVSDKEQHRLVSELFPRDSQL